MYWRIFCLNTKQPSKQEEMEVEAEAEVSFILNNIVSFAYEKQN